MLVLYYYVDTCMHVGVNDFLVNEVNNNSPTQLLHYKLSAITLVRDRKWAIIEFLVWGPFAQVNAPLNSEGRRV